MLIDTEYGHLIFKSFILEKALWLFYKLHWNSGYRKVASSPLTLTLHQDLPFVAGAPLQNTVTDRQTEFTSCPSNSVQRRKNRIFSQDHSQSFVLAVTAVLNRLTFKHLSKLCACTLASDKRGCVCRSQVLLRGARYQSLETSNPMALLVQVPETQ